MANSSLNTVDILFDTFVEAFDSMCALSNAVSRETIEPQELQRGKDILYVRQNYHASTLSGLDISAATGMDVIDRSVPLAFNDPQNVLYSLDSKEMRDATKMRKQGEAAAQALAAYVDTTLYNRAVDRANICLFKSGAFTWNMAQEAETQLIQRGIASSQAKLFMNATDYQAVAADLGGKAYMSDWSKNAYERSQVPDIAKFMSFRTDNLKNVTARGTVTGTTINGNQSFTVTSMTGNTPTDNRQMTLTVQGANVANIKAGDTFTIANVNAVHMITKEDTGVLQTFRVLAVAGSGTSLTISPAIVISGPYQNVTTQAANSAAVSFVNAVTKPANLFFAGDAIQLMYSDLEFPVNQGVQVRKSRTANGVPLTMSYGFDQLKAKTTFRFHTYFAAEAVDPEKIGIIVANQ